jgi:hypothetical protein
MMPLSKTPALGKIYLILEAFGWSGWMHGSVPGRGGRRARQTGGEILAPTYTVMRKRDGVDYS